MTLEKSHLTDGRILIHALDLGLRPQTAPDPWNSRIFPGDRSIPHVPRDRRVLIGAQHVFRTCAALSISAQQTEFSTAFKSRYLKLCVLQWKAFLVCCVLQKAIQLLCLRRGRIIWSSYSDASQCNIFKLNLFAALIVGYWLWLMLVKAFWFLSLLGLTAWPFIQFFDLAFPRLWMEDYHKHAAMCLLMPRDFSKGLLYQNAHA